MSQKIKRQKQQQSQAGETGPISTMPELGLAEALADARRAIGDPAELSDDEIRDLHQRAEHALTAVAAASRSYAVRAYTLGFVLHVGKRTHRRTYTAWVEGLGIPERSARRAKWIYESLERLVGETGQNWPVSLLDLRVDKLEAGLRGALHTGSDGGSTDTEAGVEPADGQDGLVSDEAAPPVVAAAAEARADVTLEPEPMATGAPPQLGMYQGPTDVVDDRMPVQRWRWLEGLEVVAELELPTVVDLEDMPSTDRERYARALLGAEKRLGKLTHEIQSLKSALLADAKRLSRAKRAAG